MRRNSPISARYRRAKGDELAEEARRVAHMADCELAALDVGGNQALFDSIEVAVNTLIEAQTTIC
jgi:hypothetical protein